MTAKGQFNGKNIVVTGGGSGIGASVCQLLSEQGGQLIIVDVDESKAQQTAGEIVDNGCLAPIVLAADVCNEEDMAQVSATVREQCSSLDALVHCAGILRFGDRGPRPLVDTTVEEWDALININLKGTFLCNRAVLPTMIKQRSGHIINISSTSGIQGRAFDAAYCASKFGVIGLSHSLVEEVGHYGVRVNVLLPDAVNTPMWDQNGPLRRPEEALPPERVAELVSFILAIPRGTVLGDVAIKAFKTRRRKQTK